MNEAAKIIPIGHNRLDFLKRRIVEGYERANRGGAEWVEGSLQMAEALCEGREVVPADISFKDWLKQNKLDFLSHHDRAALIKLGEDIVLARKVLTETDSKSYERIWAQNKSRFTSARKPPVKRKPRTSLPGQAMLNRTMKLGEETMAKIKGTSLDSAAEMDELVMLNRGAAPGEHTTIVKQLVEDAAAGKPVSAIAETARITRRKVPPGNLAEGWKKRMIAAWEMSNREQRIAFVISLVRDLKHAEDQDKVALAILDREKGGLA